MTEANQKSGHRVRLRQRFLSNPESTSDAELLELVLTYAIPRKDVASITNDLLVRFGDINRVLTASYHELLAVRGIGKQAAILIKAITQLMDIEDKLKSTTQKTTARPFKQEIQQPKLFEVEPDLGPLFKEAKKPKEPQMRTFANDEIANSLRFIPEAVKFEDINAFKAYLVENLPYNSISTRQRRISYIVNRYFPEGKIDIPLTYFASNCSSEEDLKAALLYETIKAEPLLTRVAEEFIFPALPIGFVSRKALRDFVLRHLPDLSSASQKKVHRSLYRIYTLLSNGIEDDGNLHIQIHKGTLEGFLYALAAKYPEPGVFSFQSLFDGPVRHWLLWDKEWIRQQLYNLQDFGIISKVSEIDTVRQFSLQLDQMEALHTYFDHPERDTKALREGGKQT